MFLDLVKKFSYKDGEWSKTAFWLSVATAVGIFLWLFQSLFVGLVIYGWTVPAFEWQATIAMMTVISTLYVTNHKIKAKVSNGSVELEQVNNQNEQRVQ